MEEIIESTLGTTLNDIVPWEEADQAITALAAPEADQPQASAGALVLTEDSILDLIEKRLSSIGIDASDVKERLVAKLTAKALADHSITSSVTDRLRDSSTFLNSISQQIRDFITNGEGSRVLEDAIADCISNYNLEAQISNEVKSYISGVRDIHGTAARAANRAVTAQISNIRDETGDLAAAAKVLAKAIKPTINAHIEDAIAQRHPCLEGGFQKAIDRLNRYRESIGLLGTQITFKAANRRHIDGNVRLYIDTPKPPADFWTQHGSTRRLVSPLLSMCENGDYIAYGGNEISADDFAYLTAIPSPSGISGVYEPLTCNGLGEDRIALEAAKETFEAFAFGNIAAVPRGAWSMKYVAHHIRQKTNLGLHFMASGYRIAQDGHHRQDSKIVRLTDIMAKEPLFSLETLNGSVMMPHVEQ